MVSIAGLVAGLGRQLVELPVCVTERMRVRKRREPLSRKKTPPLAANKGRLAMRTLDSLSVCVCVCDTKWLNMQPIFMVIPVCKLKPPLSSI